MSKAVEFSPDMIDTLIADAKRIQKSGGYASVNVLFAKRFGSIPGRKRFRAIRAEMEKAGIKIRRRGGMQIHDRSLDGSTANIIYKGRLIPKEKLDLMLDEAKAINSSGREVGVRRLLEKHFDSRGSDRLEAEVRRWLAENGVSVGVRWIANGKSEADPLDNPTPMAQTEFINLKSAMATAFSEGIAKATQQQQEPIPGVLGGMTAESIIEMKEKLDEDYQASIGEALDELNATARRQDELDLALSRLADEGNIRAHVLLMHRLGVR